MAGFERGTRTLCDQLPLSIKCAQTFCHLELKVGDFSSMLDYAHQVMVHAGHPLFAF